VPISDAVRDKHRVGAVFLVELLLEGLNLGARHFESWPAIPLKARRLVETAKTCHQSARRHLKLELIVLVALDGDGQAVGREE